MIGIGNLGHIAAGTIDAHQVVGGIEDGHQFQLIVPVFHEERGIEELVFYELLPRHLNQVEQHKVAVRQVFMRDAKGLAGLLVEIGQFAVFVEGYHVDHSRSVDGLVAYHHLLGTLQSQMLVGGIDADAHNDRRHIVLSTQHRELQDVVAHLAVIGSHHIKSQLGALIRGQAVQSAAYLLEVFHQEELGKLNH